MTFGRVILTGGLFVWDGRGSTSESQLVVEREVDVVVLGPSPRLELLGFGGHDEVNVLAHIQCLQIRQVMDGVRQSNQPIGVQDQLLQLATPVR